MVRFFFMVGKMDKCTAEEDFILKMGINMKVILKTGKERDKGFILGLITPFIKVYLSDKKDYGKMIL